MYRNIPVSAKKLVKPKDSLVKDKSQKVVTKSMRKAALVLALCLVLTSGLMAGCFEDDPVKTNKAPEASFTISSSNVLVNENIDLDGSASIDQDGEIVSYTWNLGDGAILTGSQVSHSYSAQGEYLVKLTVEDDKGKTSVAEPR